MKRRNFIKTGSLAAVAMSLPASSVLAQSGCSPEDHIGEKQFDDYKYTIRLSLCSRILDDISNATDTDRIAEMNIAKIKTGETFGTTYNAKYKITSSKKRNDNTNITDVVAERIEEVTTSLTPPSELDVKKLKFTYIFSASTANSAVIKDKKGNDYISLPVEVDEVDPEDCFLTTACVHTLGKPDNCTELHTLRNFRDTIMVDMEGGKEMIQEYYRIAPGIVQNINSHSEKKEIYLGIYNNMLMPVIEHISNNNYEEAVAGYRDYTLVLKEKYAA